MKRKPLFAAVLAAGSLMGLASVAQAIPAVVATPGTYSSGPVVYGAPPVYGAPGETVIVQSAPPAPVYEALPAPREGYIWAPGHYVWQHGRYEWMGGEWIPSRPGFAWQAAHWEQRADGSWVLMAGHWVPNDRVAYGARHDRDGDGVPNRYDAFPNDPYRH